MLFQPVRATFLAWYQLISYPPNRLMPIGQGPKDNQSIYLSDKPVWADVVVGVPSYPSAGHSSPFQIH